jgi:hypothetical protein
MGIPASSGTTHICARVTLSTHPVAIGWLIHQVRPTDDGAEMRFRFFLNDTGILDLPARSLSPSADGRALASPWGAASAVPRCPSSRRA